MMLGAVALLFGIALAGIVPAASEPEPEPPLAPKSRLPYPAGAEIWVDAEGVPLAAVPGVELGAVKRVRVLIFRPAGDRVGVPELVPLFVAAEILPPNPRPVLSVLAGLPPVPAAAAAARHDLHLYKTRNPSELLGLGLRRHLVPGPQPGPVVAYGVVLTGRVEPAGAAVQVQAIVDSLAAREAVARLAPPVPPGSVLTSQVRVDGPRLPLLVRNIEGDPTVPVRMKEITRAVIPQARMVLLHTWRTPGPLSGKAVVDFYLEQAAQRGWGPPVSRDESVPGQPMLLFQRPNDEGVLMVRAVTTPLPAPGVPAAPGAPSSRAAATMIVILEMPGRIDLDRLKPPEALPRK